MTERSQTARPRAWYGNICMRCGGKRSWAEDGDVDVSTCRKCGAVEHFLPPIDLADFMPKKVVD